MSRKRQAIDLTLSDDSNSDEEYQVFAAMKASSKRRRGGDATQTQQSPASNIQTSQRKSKGQTSSAAPQRRRNRREDDDDDDDYNPEAARRLAQAEAGLQAALRNTGLTLEDLTQPAAPRSSKKAPPKPKAPKQPKPPPPPKRTDRYGMTVVHRAHPSFAIQQRIDRALSVGAGAAHRLFLLDTKCNTPPNPETGGVQEFQVLGATGNVYTVEISRYPRCTCPDHAKGNICKHILFCFLRVLRRSPDDPVIWQKALLPSEVYSVLQDIQEGPADRSALANDRVRQAFADATGRQLASSQQAAQQGAAQSQDKPAKPVEGDCPICFEEMKAGAEAVTTCGTCKNHFHKMCFDKWSAAKRSSGARVTCALCRAPWADTAAAVKPAGGAVGADGEHMSAGYLNLSQAAGIDEDASLYDLYGDSADFISAHASGYGLGRAISRRGLGRYY